MWPRHELDITPLVEALGHTLLDFTLSAPYASPDHIRLEKLTKLSTLRLDGGSISNAQSDQFISAKAQLTADHLSRRLPMSLETLEIFQPAADIFLVLKQIIPRLVKLRRIELRDPFYMYHGLAPDTPESHRLALYTAGGAIRDAAVLDSICVAKGIVTAPSIFELKQAMVEQVQLEESRERERERRGWEARHRRFEAAWAQRQSLANTVSE